MYLAQKMWTRHF